MLSARRPPTMTTLLEIKSSVLRQVQVRPSIRRRTEGEPGHASADPQEPAAGAWWVPAPDPVQSCAPGRPSLAGPAPPAAPARPPGGSPGESEPKAGGGGAHTVHIRLSPRTRGHPGSPLEVWGLVAVPGASGRIR